MSGPSLAAIAEICSSKDGCVGDHAFGDSRFNRPTRSRHSIGPSRGRDRPRGTPMGCLRADWGVSTGVPVWFSGRTSKFGGSAQRGDLTPPQAARAGSVTTPNPRSTGRLGEPHRSIRVGASCQTEICLCKIVEDRAARRRTSASSPEKLERGKRGKSAWSDGPEDHRYLLLRRRRCRSRDQGPSRGGPGECERAMEELVVPCAGRGYVRPQAIGAPDHGPAKRGRRR
jgi:hypothetical protein